MTIKGKSTWIESDWWLSGLEKQRMGMTANEYRLSFAGDENVLELYSGGSCPI